MIFTRIMTRTMNQVFKSHVVRTFVAMVTYGIAVVISGSALSVITLKSMDIQRASSEIHGNASGSAASNGEKLSVGDILLSGRSITSLVDFDSLFYRVNIVEELKSCINGTPFSPLQDYKNPCWVSRINNSDPYWMNDNVHVPSKAISRMSEMVPVNKLPDNFRWRMRCFPSAMIIGVSKSGTTDIFERICRHPDIFPPARKEIRFWNRQRIGRLRLGPAVNMLFTEFLDYFDLGAHNIMNHHTVYDGRLYHPGITMEATPHYLWDYEGWESIPGNKDLLEPRFILAHSLYAIQPNLKFIVILRNPTDRLYSQFHMVSLKHQPSVCNSLVEKSIEIWNKCLSWNTERGCAYNATLNPYEYTNPGGMTLRAGMYAIYLRDWFDVYPRSQFLIIRAEDYYGDTSATLKRVFSFLNVTALSDPDLLSFEDGLILNSNKEKRVSSKEPMLNSTRKLLDDFYRPYNQELAKLLGDDGFLWK